MTGVEEEEACRAVLAEAAGIICSLRAGDLAGWKPPWRSGPTTEALVVEPTKKETVAWPAVTRGKRSRSRPSRRRSPSGSAAAKGRRRARGSPASPLDYSAASASGGSGASTSGGEDGGAFCSPPAPSAASAAVPQSVPAAVTPASSAKVCSAGVRRPPPRPAAAAGPRSRKKMRLPEVQQLVRSLAAENDGLREEVESLQRACSALSSENGTLETRLEHSSSKRKRTVSEEDERLRQQKPPPPPQLGQHAPERHAGGGFVLPDLNIPAADDVGSEDRAV